jgi:hypothetical protein
MTGRFVSALPGSVLRLHPKLPYGVAIVTLKNRTLIRVVEEFIRSTVAHFQAS